MESLVRISSKYLLQKATENSTAWFDTEYTEEEIKEQEMMKPLLSEHEKYGCAIGGILARDFTCKSKTEDVPDVSDLIVALGKGTIIDVCFCFNKVKLSAGKYSIGVEITQINITGVSTGGDYQAFAIEPASYETGKVSLTDIQQHEKGGKFCKVLYDEKPLRFRLTGVVGRIFKFEKEGPVSYSMSIRLSDATLRKMIEGINTEIFDILATKSKEYYGAKKTPKLLKSLVKALYSYNKTDQEKINKGEKPSFDPSIWIKIFHNDEKGFDGKITNLENGKPIINTEDLIGKDLNISSIEAYSRHIWFGPKGTSINLTLNKCAVSYETTEYDMDDVQGNDEGSETQEATENVDEVVNNSDEE